jgi:hypothetical protein
MLILLMIVCLNSFSQKAERNVYSGGMLIIQSGYTMTDNGHQKINHYSWGLGGLLRFYFARYFTAGIYGGTQKATYSSSYSKSSYLSLGYGGPFVGFSYRKGRARYTASAFAGMGSVKNLHIEVQNGSSLTEAWLYKKSRFVFSPVLSFDYALSERLNLTVQAVCLSSNFESSKKLMIPTLQAGLLFNR